MKIGRSFDMDAKGQVQPTRVNHSNTFNPSGSEAPRHQAEPQPIADERKLQAWILNLGGDLK